MAELQKQPLLFGLGNPLLDICATAKEELLEKYGLKGGNAILAEDSHKPLYDEIVKDYDVEYIAGGSAQNTVRVCQWMTQQSGATAYSGCVGKDNFGSTLKKCAEGDGVTCLYYEIDTHATGTCAVLLVNKERSMVANLSAANEFKIEHLEQKDIANVWQNCLGYFVEGYFFTVATPSILLLAKYASEQNKVFALSLSAPFICEFFNEQVMSVIPYIDVIFGNETEAEAFAKKMGWEDTTPKGAAAAIAKLEKANSKRRRIVVITCGKDDTVVAHDDVVETFPVPQLKAEEIVDTNGAGDAFAGGFMSYHMQGKSVVECVTAGQYASRVILGVSGTKLNGKPSLQ